MKFTSGFLLYLIPSLAVVALIAVLAQRPAETPPSHEEEETDDVSVIPETGDLPRASQDLVLSCTSDMATRYHIHPYLTIYVDGARQVIPAEIGIEEGKCMHPIHTHDATGKIHVESPNPARFTLGDFFLVWGKKMGDFGTLKKMTVNGEESTDGEGLAFVDGDQIVLWYETAK